MCVSKTMAVPRRIILFPSSILFLLFCVNLAIDQQKYNLLFKPTPRKCYPNNDGANGSMCKAINGSFCPSFSFLRNTSCYRCTHIYRHSVPAEVVDDDSVSDTTIVELKLKTLFKNKNSKTSLTVSSSSSPLPKLLTHRFEALGYNKKLHQYISQ